MAHRIDGRKLSRKHGPRMSLYKNLTVSVLRYERVKTTEAKAKEIQGRVENVITLAKRGDLSARRAIVSQFPNEPLVVNKLFDEIAPKYADRTSGFTRIVRLGQRRGDAAEIVQIELVVRRGRETGRCAVAQRSNMTARTLPGSRSILEADGPGSPGGRAAAPRRRGGATGRRGRPNGCRSPRHGAGDRFLRRTTLGDGAGIGARGAPPARRGHPGSASDAATFQPRYAARYREYRYTVWNGPRSPLRERTALWVRVPLDTAAMERAGSAFIGRHDFSPFGATDRSPVRTVMAVRVRREGRLVTIDVRADSFLRGMVRRMVALLIEVGLGKMDEAAVRTALNAGRPALDGAAAPARGLASARRLRASAGRIERRTRGTMNVKTITVRESEIDRRWYVVDATGETLGRLASHVARVLEGKHKPLPYRPTSTPATTSSSSTPRRSRSPATSSNRSSTPATAATRRGSSRSPSGICSRAGPKRSSAAPSRACCRTTGSGPSSCASSRSTRAPTIRTRPSGLSRSPDKESDRMATPAFFSGTGRRKTAIARVRLLPGEGEIVVNGRSIEEHFGNAVNETERPDAVPRDRHRGPLQRHGQGRRRRRHRPGRRDPPRHRPGAARARPRGPSPLRSARPAS